MILARAPILRRSVVRSSMVPSRSVHIENTVGNNMPFSYDNRKTFAVKLVLFMAGGFSIPFAAAYYQLRKASAGA
ncbi:cytochrome c oxidase subunit VIIc [Gautieria morchelliformis]|nr:cytochrome c oxidase subunit VIIc [Gautieria morchelliformis]